MKKKYKYFIKRVKFRIRMIFLRDIKNILDYGKIAPLYAERIYVDPTELLAIDLDTHKKIGWGPKYSGKVIESWPLSKSDYIPLTEVEKINYCIKHWVDGTSWEDTGEYSFYKKKSNNMNSIIKRHKELDRIFEEIKKDGKLKTRKELSFLAYREEFGIRINIGPEGELIFADGGTHRIAIALILGFKQVPAQIGCIDRRALTLLPRLRKKVEYIENESLFYF
ncbi:hypothetical protein [Salipaludibacillus daqingensis]|uniref:hypothetical protein n=1 Tax=Salipaludibacillus daqingensis TaxID=3041001 RepID=UPI002475D759|nr:hypothetical protein [Salipaludibacillus daqingensis]